MDFMGDFVVLLVFDGLEVSIIFIFFFFVSVVGYVGY